MVIKKLPPEPPKQPLPIQPTPKQSHKPPPTNCCCCCHADQKLPLSPTPFPSAGSGAVGSPNLKTEECGDVFFPLPEAIGADGFPSSPFVPNKGPEAQHRSATHSRPPAARKHRTFFIP